MAAFGRRKPSNKVKDAAQAQAETAKGDARAESAAGEACAEQVASKAESATEAATDAAAETVTATAGGNGGSVGRSYGKRLKRKSSRRCSGDRKALDKVSIEVPEGAFLSIFGPNGAGKTTLVRTLATLSRATSGTALVAGFDAKEEPDKVREQHWAHLAQPHAVSRSYGYGEPHVHCAALWRGERRGARAPSFCAQLNSTIAASTWCAPSRAA